MTEGKQTLFQDRLRVLRIKLAKWILPPGYYAAGQITRWF